MRSAASSTRPSGCTSACRDLRGVPCCWNAGSPSSPAASLRRFAHLQRLTPTSRKRRRSSWVESNQCEAELRRSLSSRHGPFAPSLDFIDGGAGQGFIEAGAGTTSSWVAQATTRSSESAVATHLSRGKRERPPRGVAFEDPEAADILNGVPDATPASTRPMTRRLVRARRRFLTLACDGHGGVLPATATSWLRLTPRARRIGNRRRPKRVVCSVALGSGSDGDTRESAFE